VPARERSAREEGQAEEMAVEEGDRKQQEEERTRGRVGAWGLPRRGGREMAVQLLLLQRADGTFGPEGVARLLGIARSQLENMRTDKLSELSGLRGESEWEGVLCATVMAVALMRSVLDAWRGLWELQEAKAVWALRERGLQEAALERCLAVLCCSHAAAP